jgi:hypothetical protein
MTVVAASSCRAQARHPRLAVLKSRKGVDGGSEHVPGLVPGSHHDGKRQPAASCHY